MIVVTFEQLYKLCPHNKNIKVLQNVSDAINKVCPLYGINTPDILHEFLANLIEECGEFTVFEENLSYSAGRLMAVWPRRFPTLAIAKQYEYNPRKLAEKVYGNRKDLGNTSAADGWTLRGSGPIQITGRNNITHFAAYMEKRFSLKMSVEEWAEVLRADIEYGLHSACWIFAVSQQLIDEAIADDMRTIVMRINGGLTNYAIRQNYYLQCQKIIV